MLKEMNWKMKLKLLIKKKKLQENIKTITSQKESINSEHRKAVNKIIKYRDSKKYGNNLELIEKIEELEEDLEMLIKQLILLIKIDVILTVLIYMVITKILVKNMILTVLIEMVITLPLMMNIILEVLI